MPGPYDEMEMAYDLMSIFQDYFGSAVVSSTRREILYQRDSSDVLKVAFSKTGGLKAVFPEGAFTEADLQAIQRRIQEEIAVGSDNAIGRTVLFSLG
jgi:hypothetical protein